MKYNNNIDKLVIKYLTIAAITFTCSGDVLIQEIKHHNLEKQVVFTQVMDQLYPYAMYLGRTILHTSYLEDDQESVIISAVYEAVRHHDPIVRFESRMFQTIKSRLINHQVRSKKKTQNQVSLDAIPEHHFSREDTIQNAILEIDLDRALNSLPPVKREILILQSEGYSYEEIAEIYAMAYGEPVSMWTIRTWSNQAKSELKKSGLLASYGPL